MHQLERTLAALADGTRKSVVDLLAQEPRRAGEIAEALKLSPPALSRHLRVLRRSGLIAEEGIDEDARVRIYHLRREPFTELRGWLDQVETFWVGQLSSFKDHVEMKARKK
jgi:DNA-binding transcriptional ArsR family regulator